MFAHLACVKTLRLKFVRLSILLGSLPAASIESNASRGSGTPATLADKREFVWDSRVLIGASLHWDTPGVRQELLDSRRNTGKRVHSPDCATPPLSATAFPDSFVWYFLSIQCPSRAL